MGNPDLEGDTILVEARRTAYQGSPVREESLEDQIADLGAEVHKGGSKGERAIVEGSVEVVADGAAVAAGCEQLVGFALSVAARMEPVALVVVAVQTRKPRDGEHSITSTC